MENSREEFATREEVIQEFINKFQELEAGTKTEAESLANSFLNYRRTKIKKRFISIDVENYIKGRNTGTISGTGIKKETGINNIFKEEEISDFIQQIQYLFFIQGINNYKESTIRFLHSNTPEFIHRASPEILKNMIYQKSLEFKSNVIFEKINAIDLQRFHIQKSGDICSIITKNKYIQRYWIELLIEKGYQYSIIETESGTGAGKSGNDGYSENLKQKTNNSINDLLNQQQQ